ncbi:MAG: rod shape-determining protein MreD [Ruminococcaceae bacterium]|nr:rod shape-determining protein MreD [Oscillospiraceae bacterium]
MIKENLPIYIKRFVLGFIIVLAALLQNTPGAFPKMSSANAMLLIPVVVCIAMFESELVSMFFGLGAGMLWDFVSVRGHYFHAIIFCIFAFFISVLVRRRIRNTLFSSMIFTFTTVFVHNTLYWILYVLIPNPEGAVVSYFRFYLLSCIYTMLVGIVIYFIIRPIERVFKV